MTTQNNKETRNNLDNYLIKWEVFSGKEGVDEGIRIEAEDVATKEIMLKDIPQNKIGSLTHNLVDNCRGMASLLESALKPSELHTSVTAQLALVGLHLLFEHRAVFKTFAFKVLLERQLTNTETRFEQVARSLHQQLVAVQNDVRHLNEENAALKQEIDRLWRAVRSPFYSFEPEGVKVKLPILFQNCFLQELCFRSFSQRKSLLKSARSCFLFTFRFFPIFQTQTKPSPPFQKKKKKV